MCNYFMKKIYLEPKTNIIKIVLEQMMEVSPGAGISEDPYSGPFGTKDNILDDWEGLE